MFSFIHSIIITMSDVATFRQTERSCAERALKAPVLTALIAALALFFGACPNPTAISNPPVVVSDLDLTALVTAPGKGAVPDTTVINAGQYTGTIEWRNADGSSLTRNFAEGTVYTAVVTLRAKAGFTFNGVEADSFRYNGAAATNGTNNGKVTLTWTDPAEPGQQQNHRGPGQRNGVHLYHYGGGPGGEPEHRCINRPVDTLF
jgi:hypothetical protein